MIRAMGVRERQRSMKEEAGLGKRARETCMCVHEMKLKVVREHGNGGVGKGEDEAK